MAKYVEMLRRVDWTHPNLVGVHFGRLGCGPRLAVKRLRIVARPFNAKMKARVPDTFYSFACFAQGCS